MLVYLRITQRQNSQHAPFIGGHDYLALAFGHTNGSSGKRPWHNRGIQRVTYYRTFGRNHSISTGRWSLPNQYQNRLSRPEELGPGLLKVQTTD